MSLYLKYRPQNFESVVGQHHVKKTLQSAVLNETMAHAYLFCGPRGTGKTSMARILAKRLNCLNPANNEPCNKCEICQAINQARLVDLIEIDAASNRGIDEIRELREKIVFSPTQAKYKVYIIDEVHMLTKEAFNALLKTLEEPPSHAYFILATTEFHKIPETIISRCQQFNFSRIELSDIADRLQTIVEKESGQADREALELIAKLSHGGLRDAIGLLEQMLLIGNITTNHVSHHLGLTGVHHLEQFFAFLIEKKPVEAMRLVQEIKSQGKSMPQFVKELVGYMREQMHLNLNDAPKASKILDMIEAFLKARQQIDLSPIPELPIEMAILRACDFYVQPHVVSPQKVEEIKEVPSVIPKVALEQGLGVKDSEKSVSPLPEPTISSAARDELSFKVIQEKWAQVVEAISTPFVKISLSDGEPVEYVNQTLTLHFRSSAFLEKIRETTNQKEVQEAFQKIFGQQIPLKLETPKIALSSLQKKQENSPSSESPSAIDVASEVFGVK